MKWCLLFFFWVIPKLLSAQTDTMVVELTNGTIKVYSVEAISHLFFDEVTEVKDLENMENILRSFTLKQNYPNPFNPTTTIEYEIPQAGEVDIAIYDINGKKIRELEKSVQSSGSYRVAWDSRNDAGRTVASGTYFYRVQYNGTQLVNKLLLLK